MKKTGIWVLAMVITMIAVVGLMCLLATAGDKEELQSRLSALLQEERAISAEFQLYQVKIAEIQKRAPELRKEQEQIRAQLKAIEDKEKASKAPKAPEKPAEKR